SPRAAFTVRARSVPDSAIASAPDRPPLIPPSGGVAVTQRRRPARAGPPPPRRPASARQVRNPPPARASKRFVDYVEDVTLAVMSRWRPDGQSRPPLSPPPGPQMRQSRHLGSRVVTIWQQRYLRDVLGCWGISARGRAAGPEIRCGQPD